MELNNPVPAPGKLLSNQNEDLSQQNSLKNALMSSLKTCSIVRWVILTSLALLVGHVCYEAFLVACGAHFDQFVDHNYNILVGHADIYVFQQRILPSLIIQGLSRVFHIEFDRANYIYYRALFVLISIAFTVMCAAARLETKRIIILLLLFSTANVFVIVSGYWLVAFDLQNELFIALFFALYISDLSTKHKLILFLLMALAWQFTFEEVIYIPIIYLINLNIDDLKKFRFKTILINHQNWILGASAVLSEIVTSYVRVLLHKGGGAIGPITIFGQWVMVSPNLISMYKQAQAIIRPGRTLKDGYYWVQGSAIFILMVICGVCLVQTRIIARDLKAMSVWIMFVVMALITFVFAHLEETNTLMPMTVALFAMYVVQKKSDGQAV
jgi:hypothetical protein